MNAETDNLLIGVRFNGINFKLLQKQKNANIVKKNSLNP